VHTFTERTITSSSKERSSSSPQACKQGTYIQFQQASSEMPSVADYADADVQELSAQAPTITLAEDSESAAKLVLSMLNALTSCKVVLVK
jgi:cephalosporin hydroxylase